MLLTVLEEINYLQGSIKESTSPELKDKLGTKRDHLITAGEWVEKQIPQKQQE